MTHATRAAGRAWPRQALPTAVASLVGLGLLLRADYIVAGSFGSESAVSLASEYSSNPYLLTSGPRAAESVAFLANLPATYTGDETSFDLDPQFRFAQTHGVYALLSDYQYVDTLWKLLKERDLLSISADWHRDSTLYNEFENGALAGTSLHRLEALASVNWKHQLSERSDAQLESSVDQVLYGRSDLNTLSNFQYVQELATYERFVTPLTQMTVGAGFGRFDVLDQSFHTDNAFVQVGIKRALSELWTLTGQVGYSSLKSITRVPELVVVPYNGGFEIVEEDVAVDTTGANGSYAGALARSGERWTLELSASRALVPSGLGGLLAEEDLSMKATRKWTERLGIAVTGHQARLSDTLGQLLLGEQQYYDISVDANWLLAEHWTMDFKTSVGKQRLGAGQPFSSNVGAYLTFSRQFGRIRLR